MQMTKREIELTNASNAGRRAFKNREDKASEYKVDSTISQAWDNGYAIAKNEAIEDHRIGYF